MSVRPLIGAALLLAACQAAETPEQMQARMSAESETVTAALDAIYARMQAFIASENVDSLASLYAEDALLYPQGEPLVEGREAIRAKYAEWFAMGNAAFENRRISVTANGPLAIERGRFTMTITPEPGDTTGMPAMTETGKYVVVWKNVNGTWLISDDIGTSDQMMAPPGAGESH
jgi:ketosteroid isomerase-like protein